MKIRSIRRRSGSQQIPVYDITVSNTHSYVVDDCVVVSNSKRVSLLDVNAMLSHGATENLRDAGSIRGQKHEDWWMQFVSGYTPQEPKVPKVYEKYVNTLKAAGIDVVKKGQQSQIMALTNNAVDNLARDREITSGDTVHFDKDLKPVPGGLFDPKMTGGHGGMQWSAIPLHEPMPNPVMEEPIRRLLGLTQKEYEGVISGDHSIGSSGTGPKAITAELSNINVTKEIAQARAQIKSGSRGKRDDAVRRLEYLKTLERTGMEPSDWILKRAPVLPPAYRPVSMMGQSGLPLVSDPNYLYKDLIEANNNLKDMVGELGDDGVGQERLAVYHAFKAVTGLGDAITPKSRDKKVKGLLSSIFGSSPKTGVVQRKLISSTVDNVGRAVITPNPDYDMDTVGIPENKAFDVYEKFVLRKMRQRGMPFAQAMQHVKDKTDTARNYLLQEMEDRPVYINRAPVLHRFGIMAFRPKLVKGDVMQVSPTIVKGFGADFDGDAMQFHVPTTDSAVKEAYDRMMPSKNLISPSDFRTPVHAPTREYQGGLFDLTKEHKDKDSKKKRKTRYFRSREDAIRAYKNGNLSSKDPVHIMEG